MSPSGLHVLSRVGAALLGGYTLVWGFTAFSIVVAMGFGVSYGDAQTTAYLLAFLLFLIAILWAFTARSLLRVWVLLAGGGALLTSAAWWLAPRFA